MTLAIRRGAFNVINILHQLLRFYAPVTYYVVYSGNVLTSFDINYCVILKTAVAVIRRLSFRQRCCGSLCDRIVSFFVNR